MCIHVHVHVGTCVSPMSNQHKASLSYQPKFNPTCDYTLPVSASLPSSLHRWHQWWAWLGPKAGLVPPTPSQSPALHLHRLPADQTWTAAGAAGPTGTGGWAGANSLQGEGQRAGMEGGAKSWYGGRGKELVWREGQRARMEEEAKSSGGEI